MTFKKGDPKPATSGRRKGAANLKRVLRVQEVLERNGKDPIEEVLQLLPDLQPREAIKVWLELQSYCEAKPRPPEADPEAAQPENPADALDTADLLSLVSVPAKN